MSGQRTGPDALPCGCHWEWRDGGEVFVTCHVHEHADHARKIEAPVADCALCGERRLLVKCQTCGRRVCEECLRVVEEQAGTPQRHERVECAECEFGGGRCES